MSLIHNFLERGRSFFKKQPAFEPVSRTFLRSGAYTELMSRYLPFPGEHDSHEAQNLTRNFLFRHHEVNHRLGVFRWRGMQEHLDIILELLEKEGQKVIDLGGAASPLGLGSEIVDFQKKDAFGREVPYQSLEEVEGPVDLIFTSHTLEHIPDLEKVLRQMHGLLRPGGNLLVHVPSFYCERWRAGVHKNPTYNDHYWTFGLSGSETPPGLVRFCPVDEVVEKYFELRFAEYCGDDSIFIHAVKS